MGLNRGVICSEKALPDAGESSPLLDLLPASADELVRQTGQPAAEGAAALVELELEGRAVAHDGVYRRAF